MQSTATSPVLITRTARSAEGSATRAFLTLSASPDKLRSGNARTTHSTHTRARRAARLMMTGPSVLRGLVRALLVPVLLSCSSDGATSVEVGGLRFVAQPTTTAAGTAFDVSVELVTAAGTRVSGANDVVTLAVGGGATLSGSTSAAAVNGVATFTGLTLTRAGSNYQLTATSGTFSNTSSAFTVEAGAVSAEQSSLVLGSTTLIPNVSSSATFTFRDAHANPIAGRSVSLSTPLAGVTFTPNTGTTDANGSFQTNVVATTAGTASISANVAGVMMTVPASIVIAPAATALRFVTQPGAIVAGVPFSVSVEFIATGGQRVTSATNPVTLSLSGGGLVTGVLTVNATAGLATFTGIGLNTAGTALVLTATGGGFTVNSTPFTVTPGTPTLAQSTFTRPAQLVVGTPAAVTFTFRDAFSNVIPAAMVVLSASLDAAFTQQTGTTSATGTFATSITFAAPGTGTVNAAVNGTPLAFPVTVTAPVTPCIVTGPITIGTPITGTVSPTSTCSLNNHRATAYTFTLPPGGDAQVIVASATGQGGFTPEVAIGPETQGASLFVAADATGLARFEWLLQPGATFRVLVSSSTTTDGTFSLNLASAGAGAPGCTSRILLAVSAVYTGQTLASTDCIDPSGPYYFDSFIIFDARPCVITLTSTFLNYILVADATSGLAEDGNKTVTTINAPSCSNAAPIRIFPSSWDPVISGPYTLSITFPAALLAAPSVQTKDIRVETGKVPVQVRRR
jgi:hypothetical protein